MRISPTFVSNSLLTRKTNNHYGYSNTGIPILAPPLKTDTVSFGRSATNAELLRELMLYRIPDLYSGKIVIPPQEFENLLSKQVFSKAVKQVVKALKPYEESMFDVEAEVYHLIKNYACIYPHKTLSDVMQILALDHSKILLNKQAPIFNDLQKLSKSMPNEQRLQYEKLMDTTLKRLNNEPIIQPFSAKEFSYKLQRIADELKAKNNLNENLIIKLMLKISRKMPEKTPEELIPLNEIQSKAKRNKRQMSNQNLIKQRIKSLKQIESLFSESSLKNNKEIGELLVRTKLQIYNQPINNPFNRKNFLHELKKITDTLEDQKLAHKMIMKAKKLPTSHEDVSAFIVKFSHSSSEKIGYNLLCGSVGNIEHIEPFKYRKGDNDCLENYAITSSYMNSERGAMPLATFIRKHPEIYQHAQTHVNRLIDLYNNGVFKKVGLNRDYIINLVQRLNKMSPPELPLVINIDRLKNRGNW